MRKYANEMIMKTSDKLHDIRNRASLIAENELVVKNLLSFRTDSRSIIHNSRKTINRDSPIVAKYGKIEKLQQSIENHLSQ